MGEGLEGVFLCFLEIKLMVRAAGGDDWVSLARPPLASDSLAGTELAGWSGCEIPASWLGCAAISTSQAFQSDLSCFLKASAALGCAAVVIGAQDRNTMD